MYELKAGSKSAHRLGNTKRNNMPSQMLRQGDRFADRNIKLGYCPAGKEGSVVQMVKRCLNCGATLNACRCGNYEPDDSGDTSYCENQHEQYLSAPALRRNLDANGKSGEAHHIFPGNIVRDKKLDNNGQYKDLFNEAWNGIMLNGASVSDPETGSDEIVHQYSGDAPAILHRNGRARNHNAYDAKLLRLINANHIRTVADCQNYEPLIRRTILDSDADCLDNM